MKKILIALAMITTTTAAVAQYTGPNATSNSTVKQLLATGSDDQYVVLKGHLINRETDKKYTFDDGTSKVDVEIPAKLFPAGKPVDANTLVQIGGKFDKKHSGASHIKVKQLDAI